MGAAARPTAQRLSGRHRGPARSARGSRLAADGRRGRPRRRAPRMRTAPGRAPGRPPGCDSAGHRSSSRWASALGGKRAASGPRAPGTPRPHSPPPPPAAPGTAAGPASGCRARRSTGSTAPPPAGCHVRTARQPPAAAAPRPERPGCRAGVLALAG